MKKRYIAGLFCLIAIATLGVAFAESETIGDFTFNIPDGYKLIDNQNSFDEPFTIENRTYQNDKGDTLIIEHHVGEGVTFSKVTPDPGTSQMTIGKYEGTFKTVDNSSYSFSYVEIGGNEAFVVKASSPDIIKEVLK